MLMGFGLVFAAEIDDAAVFVEAFNAFQKKDYLFAIEKANQLNQVFPDSPLRDINLLLIARSSIRSGDNELAAKTINKFNGEFTDSPLKSTIEEDLLALGSRLLKGETLQPNKQLQVAAQKIRDERLLLERVAAQKLEQEKLAKEKAERERIALEKAAAEKKERERLAAEKIAKESIKAVISMDEGGSLAAVGQNGSIPVEISNRGKNNEEFLLEASAAPEYGVFWASTAKEGEPLTRIKLAAGETFKGKLSFRMPADRVDGHRAPLTVRAVSAKYSDVIQAKNTLLIASAPLVRAVAKLATTKVYPGEQTQYRITILNIGSLTAQDLTVRVQLQPQLDLVSVPGVKFRQEPNGMLIFRLDPIETGKISSISINVKVRENSRIGEELRGQVEIVNGQLQRKDIFTSNLSLIQSK